MELRSLENKSYGLVLSLGLNLGHLVFVKFFLSLENRKVTF